MKCRGDAKGVVVDNNEEEVIFTIMRMNIQKSQ